MTTWYRQHRDLYKLPWHLPSPGPASSDARRPAPGRLRDDDASRRPRLDEQEEPPLDDRGPPCQGTFVRGEAG